MQLGYGGGKAPGPQPLRECLVKIDGLLSQKDDEIKVLLRSMTSSATLLTPCLLGALDVPPYLFSMEDEEMLAAKPATGGRQIPKEEEQTTLL